MTRVPPLFLGAVLTFWGWRTDLFLVGLIAGLVLESAHLFRVRWDFTDTEFNRLWDVCTLIFAGVAVVLRFSDDLVRAPYRFFQWFPLIFYLMALGHVYSTRRSVPLKAFSWFLRRRGAEGADRPIAFGWIYYALCLISAGATNHQDAWYYLGVAGFAGAALWVNRPHRLSVPGWIAVFLLAVTVGYFAQGRMQMLQSFLEAKASQLLVRFGQRDFDPRYTRTAIGRIGSIKTSSRIVMKVRPEAGAVPARLRQATYTKYDDGLWQGTRRSFEALPVEADATTWTLLASTNVNGSVRLIERLERKRALLSLPLGTIRLQELVSGGVETNQMGLVRALENPSLASYVAVFSGRDQADANQGRFDHYIPEKELPALRKITREMRVALDSGEEKVAAVRRFFETQGFGYTTYQSAADMQGRGESSLAHFLLKTRAGHCEYFASATVLLLRELGVPARYVTGYAVQEWDDKAGEYIVRDRHAHAWAIAQVGGRWIEVDTTPADWAEAERAAQSRWDGLKEWWNNLSFSFLEWRWLGERGIFRLAAPWLIGVMVAFLAWRVFGRKMRGQTKKDRGEPWPGSDSEFYLLERKLERAGLARALAETPARWAKRVETEAPELGAALRNIVHLHYRYRFDPAGLGGGERDELRRLVRRCLAELRVPVR